MNIIYIYIYAPYLYLFVIYDLYDMMLLIKQILYDVYLQICAYTMVSGFFFLYEWGKGLF